MNQLRGHVDTFTSIIALRKDENNDENENWMRYKTTNEMK